MLRTLCRQQIWTMNWRTNQVDHWNSGHSPSRASVNSPQTAHLPMIISTSLGNLSSLLQCDTESCGQLSMNGDRRIDLRSICNRSVCHCVSEIAISQCQGSQPDVRQLLCVRLDDRAASFSSQKRTAGAHSYNNRGVEQVQRRLPPFRLRTASCCRSARTSSAVPQPRDRKDSARLTGSRSTNPRFSTV